MEIRYDTGINWCHFQIIVSHKVAFFRLHMDDDLCWNLIRLEQIRDSILKFNVSPMETRIPVGKEILELPVEFDWLEKFLTPNYPKKKFSKTWCQYHGVNFYELEN